MITSRLTERKQEGKLVEEERTTFAPKHPIGSHEGGLKDLEPPSILPSELVVEPSTEQVTL